MAARRVIVHTGTVITLALKYQRLKNVAGVDTGTMFRQAHEALVRFVTEIAVRKDDVDLGCVFMKAMKSASALGR